MNAPASKLHTLLLLIVVALWLTPKSHSCGEQYELEKQVVVSVMEQLEVPAQSEGPLVELTVREGDLVQVNDAIAKVRSDDAVLELQRAEINLENAQALSKSTVALRLAKLKNKQAKAELARAERWNEKVKDAVSKSELERLQLAFDRSVLEVEQAEEELKVAARAVAVHANAVRQAQMLLERRTMLSPVQGIVAEIAKPKGSWVKPGDAVVRVLRLDRLRVEAILPPELLLKPLEGSRVVVRIELPNRGPGEYEGRIVFVRPELNPLNRQIRVWAEIDNSELLLRPGLSGSMVIHLGEKPAHNQPTHEKRADDKQANEDKQANKKGQQDAPASKPSKLGVTQSSETDATSANGNNASRRRAQSP